MRHYVTSMAAPPRAPGRIRLRSARTHFFWDVPVALAFVGGVERRAPDADASMAAARRRSRRPGGGMSAPAPSVAPSPSSPRVNGPVLSYASRGTGPSVPRMVAVAGLAVVAGFVLVTIFNQI